MSIQLNSKNAQLEDLNNATEVSMIANCPAASTTFGRLSSFGAGARRPNRFDTAVADPAAIPYTISPNPRPLPISSPSFPAEPGGVSPAVGTQPVGEGQREGGESGVASRSTGSYTRRSVPTRRLSRVVSAGTPLAAHQRTAVETAQMGPNDRHPSHEPGSRAPAARRPRHWRDEGNR